MLRTTYPAGMTRVAAVRLLSMVVCFAALAPASALAKTPPSKAPSHVNPAVQLQALSCASTGNCGAIGSYDDGLGDSQGLLATESHGKWQRAVEAVPPAGAAVEPFKLADGGGLVDISCPADGRCAAVGRYTDSRRTDHGVLFSETHGRWGRGVRLRLPDNALAPPKPKSSAVDLLGLDGISCSTAGNCVAVGSYETTAEVWEAMIVVQRHGHWTRAVQAPLPAGAPIAAQDALLLSVTCNRLGQCAAAGAYVDRLGRQQSLLVTGTPGSWAAAPTPAAPSDANSDPNVVPSSIACAGTGVCAAVGTYINPLQNSLGLLLSESGGQWSGGTGATLPANAAPAGTVGDQTVVLASVACPQAGVCTSVGWYYDNYENSQGLLVTQNGNTWEPGVEVTLPSNAVEGIEKQFAGLDWISCASVGNCLATGVYTDLGLNTQGLLLSEVNGSWQTGVESPLPRNAGTQQYAAADQSDCTGDGDCAVIGEYTDRRGNVLGYLLGEQGGVWGRATELTLPPPTAAEARLSLQAILVPQKHAARLAQIRASRRFDYSYQAVEAGTAATGWYANVAGKRVLIATGGAHAKAPGRVTLSLHLNAAGRKLLARRKQVHVFVIAAFKPRGHHRVSAVAGFTLS